MKKLYLAAVLPVFVLKSFTIINEIPEGGLVLVGYSDVKSRTDHSHKIVYAIEFKKKNEKREVPPACKNVFDTPTKMYESAEKLNQGGFVSLSYFSPKSEFAKQYAKGKIKLHELSYDAVRKEASHTVKFFKPNFGSLENINDPNTTIMLINPEGEPLRFVLKVPETVELKSAQERKKSAEKESGKREIQVSQDWKEDETNREPIGRTRSTVVINKDQAQAAYQQRAAAIERAKAEAKAVTNKN